MRRRGTLLALGGILALIGARGRASRRESSLWTEAAQKAAPDLR